MIVVPRKKFDLGLSPGDTESEEVQARPRLGHHQLLLQLNRWNPTFRRFLSTRKTLLPTAAQSRVGSELGASAAQGQTGPARPTPLEVWECAQICCCNPPCCTGNAMDTNSQETMTKTRRSANDGR